MKWIGVDLDGTLAYDTIEHMSSIEIGKPIPSIVKLVKDLSLEHEVRIFTARVDGLALDYPVDKIVEAIEDWCALHIGFIMEVTNIKDRNMLYLLDDRAVRVETNTGKLI